MAKQRTKQLKSIARKQLRNERKHLRESIQSDLQRQNSALRRSRRSGILQVLFGAMFTFFFAFVLFALVVDARENPEKGQNLMQMGIIAFLSLCGLPISRKGIKKLYMRRLYPPYKSVLEIHASCSLSEFVTYLGKQKGEKRVQKRLLAMMQAGFFPGYHLHLTERYIYHPARETYAQKEAGQYACVSIDIPCPRCHAVNHVREDALGRCYCCAAFL